MNPSDAQIIDFSKACYNEMGYNEFDIGFDKDSVLKTIELSNNSGGCFIVEKDSDMITGIFAAMIVPNILNYNQNRAIEWFWHTLPSLPKIKRVKLMIKLLEQGIAWAGSKSLPLSISTNHKFPTIDKILIKYSFKPFEKIYTRR